MLKHYFQKKLVEKVARGVIVIDKEAGITSHDEVDRLRRLFKTRRIGHSGTLDPKVTGVLVCGLGRGTKVLEYVLLSQKVYDCEIIFHKKVTQKQFEQVMTQFQGKIVQLPPVKSSVKRVEREREVYGLELLRFAEDKRSAHIKCSVERGTYIRKLCHDIGTQLGVGAHMGDLRRTDAGPFGLHNSQVVTVSDLQALFRKSRLPVVGFWYIKKIMRCIEPIERALKGIPRVTTDSRLKKVIASGADLFVPGVFNAEEIQEGDMVQIVDENKKVLAVGHAEMTTKQMQVSEKGVAVKITKRLCV